MNKNDRALLEKAWQHMEEARIIIEGVKDGEQEKFDNLTDALQQNANGQKLESNVDELQSVEDDLQTSMDTLFEVMQ